MESVESNKDVKSESVEEFYYSVVMFGILARDCGNASRV